MEKVIEYHETKRTERNTRWGKWRYKATKKDNKMTIGSPHIAIITLNLNRLNQ